MISFLEASVSVGQYLILNTSICNGTCSASFLLSVPKIWQTIWQNTHALNPYQIQDSSLDLLQRYLELLPWNGQKKHSNVIGMDSIFPWTSKETVFLWNYKRFITNVKLLWLEDREEKTCRAYIIVRITTLIWTMFAMHFSSLLHLNRMEEPKSKKPGKKNLAEPSCFLGIQTPHNPYSCQIFLIYSMDREYRADSLKGKHN